MVAIIGVNNLNFIGKDNKLMWHSTPDLQHFKKMTEGKVMLVGYNTFQTLPEVVKKREINISPKSTQTIIHHSKTIKNIQLSDFICIGGKKTYELWCSKFTELHISHINDNQIGDCTFPDFSNLNPNCKVFNYYFEVNETKPLEQYKDEQLGKVGTEKRDEFEEEVEQGK